MDLGEEKREKVKTNDEEGGDAKKAKKREVVTTMDFTERRRTHMYNDNQWHVIIVSVASWQVHSKTKTCLTMTS